MHFQDAVRQLKLALERGATILQYYLAVPDLPGSQLGMSNVANMWYARSIIKSE